MFRPKEGSWGQGSVLSARDALDHGDGWRHHARPLRLWLDSFRRDPGRRFTASVIDAAEDRHRASMARPSDELDSVSSWGRPYFDMHAANVNTANTLLSRELKGRHLQMIAIGGSIGTCAFFFFFLRIHRALPGLGRRPRQPRSPVCGACRGTRYPMCQCSAANRSVSAKVPVCSWRPGRRSAPAGPPLC